MLFETFMWEIPYATNTIPNEQGASRVAGSLLVGDKVYDYWGNDV